MNGEEPHVLQCPYCSEQFTLMIDCSVSEQDYVEDCQICCQPIDLLIKVNGNETLTVEAKRENE